MKSRCETEIAASAVASLWRDETTVVTRSGWTAPVFWVDLHSYLLGNIMFKSSVKPNQSKSNQIKPFQILSSRETAGGVASARRVGNGSGMRRFDAILLG
jgi:hypothetical protein